MSKLEFVIAPICYNDHWRILFVDMREKTVTYLDPMGTAKMAAKKEKDIAFKSWCMFASQRPKDPIREWTWTKKDVKHPIQTDGASCGVYVLYSFVTFLVETK